MPMKNPPQGPPRHGKPDGSEREVDMEALAKETEDMLKLRYINKDNAKFEKTPGGFVSLVYDGKKYDRVGLYRAFPFTDPDRYISVREANEKAREIGIIDDLNTLDAKAADMLREQLELRYFIPTITKIIDIKDRYGFSYFHVITDKGEAKFTIRNNGGSVIHLSETRLLISDLDGNRFEVKDTSKLSAGELKKLDLFI